MTNNVTAVYDSVMSTIPQRKNSLTLNRNDILQWYLEDIGYNCSEFHIVIVDYLIEL